MSEQKKKEDVDKLKKLVSHLDDLVGVGEDIMEDGKVNFMDAQHLPALAPILEGLMESWKHKDEMIDEAKDIDWNEFKELAEEAFD